MTESMFSDCLLVLITASIPLFMLGSVNYHIPEDQERMVRSRKGRDEFHGVVTIKSRLLMDEIWYLPLSFVMAAVTLAFCILENVDEVLVWLHGMAIWQVFLSGVGLLVLLIAITCLFIMVSYTGEEIARREKEDFYRRRYGVRVVFAPQEDQSKITPLG